MNEKAAGAYEVRHYPGAMLSARDALREFGALRDGAVDMAVGSALAWSAQLPAFGVYGLPWLAPEPREQEALAQAPAVRERVEAAAANAGVVLIAIAPLGERAIATFEGGVTGPAALAGRAIRTGTIPLVVETLATLGARPASMPLADAQAQFAARTLDGQEGPASTLAAARVAASGLKFVTRWGAFADAMVFAVRQSAVVAVEPRAAGGRPRCRGRRRARGARAGARGCRVRRARQAGRGRRASYRRATRCIARSGRARVVEVDGADRRGPRGRRAGRGAGT